MVGLLVGFILGAALTALGAWYLAKGREQRLSEREARLDARAEALDQTARTHEGLLASLRLREEDLDRSARELAGITPEAARAEVIANALTDAREDIDREVRALEEARIAEAENRARAVIVSVMERCASNVATDVTGAVVELPSEDMKGRIIGREGRNIRAFEQITGVDLIVDETPETVVISTFDPIRREVARLTLMNLMLDGRIHPSRIEELHQQAGAEVQRITIEAGRKAADRARVAKLPAGIVETMGKLRFRTSYAQNVLDHSVETAILAEHLAGELKLDVALTRRAAFLHDIGKALGEDWPGSHALAGMEYLRTMGEKPAILNAVGAHHHEIEPGSPEAQLVIVADTLSAARPGARRESLDLYLKRMSALEEIANSLRGVDRSFAVQAGRELRLIVKPTEIDDDGAKRLSVQVARIIEQDSRFGTPVKVTVIRETRASTVSKPTRP